MTTDLSAGIPAFTMLPSETTALVALEKSEPWWLAGWSRHISPSSLGRAAACLRSEAMPHAQSINPFSRKGSVAHKFLADALEHGKDLALGMVEDVADTEWLVYLDVDRLPAFERESYEPEVAIAYNPVTRTARLLGKNLSREEARALAEDHELVGIVDVLGQTTDAAVAADYKTGWGYVEPAEVNWQLKTYALFAARYLGKSEAIYSVIRVRDNGSVWFDVAHMDELDLLAHEEALLELLARRQEIRNLTKAGAWESLPPLVEGQHCRYCPALFACPAKIHALRVIGTQYEDDAIARGPLTQEEQRAAWFKIKYAERYLERCKAILKDQARQTAFPLDATGSVLGEKVSIVESIVPDRARSVLEKHFGPIGAAAIGEATETKTSLTKKAFKSALKSLVMPTLPKVDQAITRLNKDALQMLRDNGAMSAVTRRTVMEHTPAASDADEATEDAA